MSAYWLGDTVENEVTFRSTAGVIADPTSVVGVAKRPSGSTLAAVITNPSTGKYDIVFTPVDEVGIWFYRVVGSGANADAVVESSFHVRASSI